MYRSTRIANAAWLPARESSMSSSSALAPSGARAVVGARVSFGVEGIAVGLRWLRREEHRTPGSVQNFVRADDATEDTTPVHGVGFASEVPHIARKRR